MAKTGSSAVAPRPSHVDLLIQPLPAVLVTVMPDGRPQASVGWVDYTDQVLTLNHERGRRKPKNMDRDPRANIVVVDAILTPRMREEQPQEDFPTFTPAEDVAEAIATGRPPAADGGAALHVLTATLAAYASATVAGMTTWSPGVAM